MNHCPALFIIDWLFILANIYPELLSDLSLGANLSTKLFIAKVVSLIKSLAGAHPIWPFFFMRLKLADRANLYQPTNLCAVRPDRQQIASLT